MDYKEFADKYRAKRIAIHKLSLSDLDKENKRRLLAGLSPLTQQEYRQRIELNLDSEKYL